MNHEPDDPEGSSNDQGSTAHAKGAAESTRGSSRTLAGDGGIPERTLAHLEWSRLRDAVLARCVGDSARRHGLSFAADLTATRAALAETREASALLAAGEPLPFGELRDATDPLDRLSRDGVLDAPAFADLLRCLACAQSLRRFLSVRRTKLPHLYALAPFDPSLDTLQDQLAHAIDLDGTLRDAASAELLRLRSEAATLRARVIGRLQDVIARHGDLLSDGFYTLREGRYVLPVRRDAHERLPGIVHGASSSGASVFVEPRAIVMHGNRLKLLEAEREREELRILGVLSELTRERLPALREAANAIDRLDLRSAGARLGRDLRACVPEVPDGASAVLRGARHPLLLLDGVDVVANDIELEAGHGLVISGPNAGGKTVVLKTLGLCALMLRCGLPIPAQDGSTLGFFGSVLSEMGDEQSTATNLSTFSAHVRNLADLLERTHPRALVLLDEVATGTDPAEGAGLACALVDAFCARGGALAVTTHYEALKALSLNDPRLRSASVALDPEHMTPTFRMLLDIPGASSALAVARRFGLPADVIEKAERFIPQQARDFERLVERLAQTAGRLEQERTALATERASIARLRGELEARGAALREQSKARLSKEAERLMGDLRIARGELDSARATLRKGERPDQIQAIEDTQRKIAQAAERIGVGSAVMAALDPNPRPVERSIVTAPSTGSLVYVTRLRSEATVLEANAKGKALVAVGAVKLWVDVSELRSTAPTQPTQAGRAHPATAAHDAYEHVMRSSENTVDVRGLRADDAMGMVESFIDRMYGGSTRVGFILHGHGTGALRNAVREHLERDLSYVERVRAGDADEGGDAVTVFYLS